MKIRFLGQSGYILKSGESEIVIDPYLSDSVNRVAGRPRLLPIPVDPREIFCDAVVCTHNHLDHLDPDTVEKIDPRQFYVTTREGKQALAALGRVNVRALREGEELQAGAFTIKAVFAKHTVEAFGLIVRAEGITLYFSGDTLFDERLFSVAKERPDYAFFCINGKLGNMNVDEALEAARQIGAPINIPNHYDLFASNSEDPRLFSQRIPGGRILEWNREVSLFPQR